MVVVYRHWFLCVFCVLWSVVVGGGGVACRNMTTENSPLTMTFCMTITIWLELDIFE